MSDFITNVFYSIALLIAWAIISVRIHKRFYHKKPLDSGLLVLILSLLMYGIYKTFIVW
jgi:hypothetical protein